MNKRERLALLPALLLPGLARSALALNAVPPPSLRKASDGTPLSVADGLGKVQMVCFWASWCGYCKKLYPVLENIQRHVGDEAMRTLLITSEEREVFRHLVRATREMKLRFAHDAGGKLQAEWGGKGYPYLVILGPDGTVRETFSGYGDSMLDPLVNEVNGALRERARAASVPG
jgi:thiol-disulfide isomerase/thioredoxin